MKKKKSKHSHSMKLSDYNLRLTKDKLPYFKKYVRGEIKYKEYAPGVSDVCKTLKGLVPLMFSIAMASTALEIMSKSLPKKL